MFLAYSRLASYYGYLKRQLVYKLAMTNFRWRGSYHRQSRRKEGRAVAYNLSWPWIFDLLCFKSVSVEAVVIIPWKKKEDGPEAVPGLEVSDKELVLVYMLSK